MTMPDHVAAVLAKAEAGGVRAAELAALRRRLSQLSERRAGMATPRPRPGPGGASNCPLALSSSMSQARDGPGPEAGQSTKRQPAAPPAQAIRLLSVCRVR